MTWSWTEEESHLLIWSEHSPILELRTMNYEFENLDSYFGPPTYLKSKNKSFNFLSLSLLNWKVNLPYVASSVNLKGCGKAHL